MISRRLRKPPIPVHRYPGIGRLALIILDAGPAGSSWADFSESAGAAAAAAADCLSIDNSAGWPPADAAAGVAARARNSCGTADCTVVAAVARPPVDCTGPVSLGSVCRSAAGVPGRPALAVDSCWAVGSDSDIAARWVWTTTDSVLAAVVDGRWDRVPAAPLISA